MNYRRTLVFSPYLHSFLLFFFAEPPFFLPFFLTSMTLRSFPTPAASSDHSCPVHACSCCSPCCCCSLPFSVAGTEAQKEEEEGGANRLSNAARKRVCSSAEKGCWVGMKEEEWMRRTRSGGGNIVFLCPSFSPPLFLPPFPSFHLPFANNRRPGAYASTYLVDWLRRSG